MLWKFFAKIKPLFTILLLGPHLKHSLWNWYKNHTDGILYGSTNGFHSHGVALNGLLSGEKDWVVGRPSVGDVEDAEAYVQDPVDGDEWKQHVWRCSQAAGELVWVPGALWHSVGP